MWEKETRIKLQRKRKKHSDMQKDRRTEKRTDKYRNINRDKSNMAKIERQTDRHTQTETG